MEWRSQLRIDRHCRCVWGSDSLLVCVPAICGCPILCQDKCDRIAWYGLGLARYRYHWIWRSHQGDWGVLGDLLQFEQWYPLRLLGPYLRLRNHLLAKGKEPAGRGLWFGKYTACGLHLMSWRMLLICFPHSRGLSRCPWIACWMGRTYPLKLLIDC